MGVGGGTESYFPSSKSKQCNWKKISTKSRTFCYFGNISKYCQMIKSRCQNRMRVDREKLINAVRNINMDEGKSFVENTIRMFVKVFEGSSLIYNFYFLL